MDAHGVPARPVRCEVIEVRAPGEPDGQLAFWCPWCETLHYHGDCGGNGAGDGPTTAHCVGDRRSPLLAAGIDLVTIGTAADETAVLPEVAMLGRRVLRRMLRQHFRTFRSAALRAILGLSAAKSREDCIGLDIKGRAGILVFGLASWRVLPKSGAEITGRGFTRLAALLYGLPAGVVAVRLLEEVSGDTFDARAALEIQAAVDAWVARGAGEREAHR